MTAGAQMAVRSREGTGSRGHVEGLEEGSSMLTSVSGTGGREARMEGGETAGRGVVSSEWMVSLLWLEKIGKIVWRERGWGGGGGRPEKSVESSEEVLWVPGVSADEGGVVVVVVLFSQAAAGRGEGREHE